MSNSDFFFFFFIFPQRGLGTNEVDLGTCSIIPFSKKDPLVLQNDGNKPL